MKNSEKAILKIQIKSDSYKMNYNNWFRKAGSRV